MPANDPFRSLAAACLPLTISGDAPVEFMKKALEARGAIDALVLAGGDHDIESVQNWSAGEQALYHSFHVATVLKLEHQVVRDLLWAAIKIFGLSRSSHFNNDDLRSKPNYWWLDA